MLFLARAAAWTEYVKDHNIVIGEDQIKCDTFPTTQISLLLSFVLLSTCSCCVQCASAARGRERVL
eukprot:48179-Rhodomonas_salina.1